MLNLKKIGIVVMVVAIMIASSSVVFATDDNTFVNIPDDSLGNRLNNNTTNNTINNTTNNVINNTTNKNTSSVYNNTSLPKAGSADSMTVLAVIAVFGVSAVYAYKRIKYYNIK